MAANLPETAESAEFNTYNNSKGDPGTPSVYRPLGMLDTAGMCLAMSVSGRSERCRSFRQTIRVSDRPINCWGSGRGRQNFQTVQQVHRYSRRTVVLVTADLGTLLILPRGETCFCL